MMDILFWTAATIPATALVFAPLATRLRASLVWNPIRPRDADHAPSLTLIISAYNENKVIRQKLENALSLNYPEGKLEILVATDGSTDGTDEIVSEYADRGVRLISSARNHGKSVALNEAVKSATHDIMVFTDANCLFHADAVAKLAAWFSNPEVGFVCGRLVYTAHRHGTAEKGEMAYWNADARLKRWEGAAGELVAGNGSIMAMRREAILPLTAGLSNDFAWCLGARYMGWKAVFEGRAIALERPAGTISREYRRKVRISHRGMQVHRYALGLRGNAPRRTSLLNRAMLFTQLFAKKGCRYLTFPAVLLMMLFGIFATSAITIAVAIVLWGVFLAALIGAWAHREPALKPLARFIPDMVYPLAMAAASVSSLFHFISGQQFTSWAKERAENEAFNPSEIKLLTLKTEV